MRPDTIVALSSGAPPAAIAVVRVSGPAVPELLVALTGALPAPRRASLRAIRHPQTGVLIDRGLVLHFPAPDTATGEELAEFHVHGGRAVVTALIRALLVHAEARAAEPGEFTRRAFLNGRMDLAAVEGLADLLAAETEAQRRRAAAQADGVLGRTAEDWRQRLVAIRMRVEALIDFSDADEIEEAVADPAWDEAAALAADLSRALNAADLAERLTGGFQVVLAGPPNAGKSSLLNALARADVAIVSEEAGTTRDLIEVRLDLAGYPVVLTDTAGLREATGLVEAEGIRRALGRAAEADLVLWLEAPDAATPPPTPLETGPAPLWRIVTKADRDEAAPFSGADGMDPAGVQHRISVRTGDGLAGLMTDLAAAASQRLAPAEDALIVRARQARLLEEALSALTAAVEGQFLPLELRAEELRLAGDALGRITGRIDVEEVLGAIFSSFCIGK
ncbi:tRNA uridine-5-carboxymethylaminomethyl(34) synthesis GTPase MnmE [Segnochrobactraceae bacterium EtOH-i3]